MLITQLCWQNYAMTLSIATRRTFLQQWAILGLVTLPSMAFPLMTSSPSIQTCIDQARQAWLAGNGEAFANLFAAEGEFIVPGQRWCGRDAILEAFTTFTDTHTVRSIEIRNLVIQGDRAMLEWSWEEVDKQTGDVSYAEDAIAIDVQDSLILRWREYIDDSSS